MPCAATALSHFWTHSTLRGNCCKCYHSWLHVQPLETQKHLVKSSQNSFHQPKNRDVHEFLPQNWLSLHQKKTNYPNTAGLPCHPCLQQSHQQPWRPFSTGEANIQGIQVLRRQVALNALHRGDVFETRDVFWTPTSFIAPRFFNMFWGVGVGVKRCWVGFWTCSQHQFQKMMTPMPHLL